MALLDALILGIVHGLTEFFPVSSSVHLLLLRELTGVRAPDIVTFEVFVRLGTLMSVLTVYRKDIWALIRAAMGASFHPLHLISRYRTDPDLDDVVRIVVASIPAVIVGLLYEAQVTAMFDDPKLVATMLVVNGLLLFLARLFRPVPGREVGLRAGFIVGCFQALAFIPGISRAGTTMSSAMYFGVPPVRAVRFSLLLSIPLIIGGVAVKAGQLAWQGVLPVDLLTLAIAVAGSYCAGVVAIRLLLRVVEVDRFRMFAFYCLVAGGLGILIL